MKRSKIIASAVLIALVLLLAAGPALASEAAASTKAASDSGLIWWAWPLILLVVTFVMGVVAVLAGVGGGVLFTPIVGSFFPFGIDFVRAAGLLVALSGALAAGPGLLRKGMADLRLAIPVAVLASSGAIVGAILGLWVTQNMPSGKSIIQVSLGVVIIAIVGIMLRAKRSELPEVKKADTLSTALKITGIYHETSTGQDIDWKIHRTPQGLISFIFIGILAGMFGLGAGWANVPVLNLLMGAPLKISVATSKFLLSITDTSAAWIYVNNGAVIPLIVVPSMVGIMLGSFVGVKLLAKTKPKMVKNIVVVILAFSGITSILKGLGLFG